MNELLMRHLTKWTGGDLKFKGNKIVQMPREWYFRDNPEHTPDNSPESKIRKCKSLCINCTRPRIIRGKRWI